MRPYASGSPRASIHPTCGPVHTSNGVAPSRPRGGPPRSGRRRCSSSPSTPAAGRASAEWVTCEYWPIQALTARERLAMTNASLLDEPRRAQRGGQLHARDGARALRHGRLRRARCARPSARGAPSTCACACVLRLPVRTRVLRQKGHDPGVGLGDLDRLRGRQMTDGGMGSRRGREHNGQPATSPTKLLKRPELVAKEAHGQRHEDRDGRRQRLRRRRPARRALAGR